MFESVWARQARVRVGLIKNSYKTKKKNDAFAKTLLSLQAGYRTFQKAYQTQYKIYGFDQALDDWSMSSLAGGNT